MRFPYGRRRNRFVFAISALIMLLFSSSLEAACCCPSCRAIIKQVTNAIDNKLDNLVNYEVDKIDEITDILKKTYEENKIRTGSKYSGSVYANNMANLSIDSFNSLYDANFRVQYSLNYLKSKQLFQMENILSRTDSFYNSLEFMVKSEVEAQKTNHINLQIKAKKHIANDMLNNNMKQFY